MSVIAVEHPRGRVEGDGQPPLWFDYLTAEQLFSPFFPTRWVGGFISRKDGSFVQNLRVHMNPQIKEMKRRSRRCAYEPEILLG
jgi:hypothetical protein